MPLKEIDFFKTIIYKIVCKDLNIKDVYVGSTTNFIQRKSSHRTCSKKSQVKIYVTIRNNGGWDNWEMIEIEKYPCLDSNEATKRERYYYELLNATLNSHNPNKPSKEWFIENKDKLKAKGKEKYICPDCNIELTYNSKSCHKKSNKHNNKNLIINKDEK